MKSVREYNTSLNEGKYQDKWAFAKYVNTKVGKDKLELVGDKSKKALGQEYDILKNGDKVGSFKLVKMDNTDYDFKLGDKSGTATSIDDLITKLDESLNESQYKGVDKTIDKVESTVKKSELDDKSKIEIVSALDDIRQFLEGNLTSLSEATKMNNLDWGKSTAERNKNLDHYESLKTDKEKEEFLKKLKAMNEDLGFSSKDDGVFISNPFFDASGRFSEDPKGYKEYKGSDIEKAVTAAEEFVKSYDYWKNHSISQEDEEGNYNEDAMYLDFYLKKNKKNLQTLLKYAK